MYLKGRRQCNGIHGDGFVDAVDLGESGAGNFLVSTHGHKQKVMDYGGHPWTLPGQ